MFFFLTELHLSRDDEWLYAKGLLIGACVTRVKQAQTVASVLMLAVMLTVWGNLRRKEKFTHNIKYVLNNIS